MSVSVVHGGAVSDFFSSAKMVGASCRVDKTHTGEKRNLSLPYCTKSSRSHLWPMYSLMKAMYAREAYELTNWNMKVLAMRLSS